MIQEVKTVNSEIVAELSKLFPQKVGDFSFFLENPFRKLYVLVEKEIVGYLFVDILYDRMELIQIEILKKYQNQGYAQKLMDYMITLAEQEKLKNITLEVKVTNFVAIHIYQKYQFLEVARRKNYYQGIDGILMERKMM